MTRSLHGTEPLFTFDVGRWIADCTSGPSTSDRERAMKERKVDEDVDSGKERVNPAARRDRPGEPHEDVHEEPASGPVERHEPPRGYQQDAELDPRDQGGIAD
jgi:hypothetical protein